MNGQTRGISTGAIDQAGGAALHDAGYNVVTYDLRNFGHSGAANGGIGTSGNFESRDVIGSLAYARTRRELSGMTIGLFSRCLGCNATLFAMSRRPEQFEGVRCLVGVQPSPPAFFLKNIWESSAFRSIEWPSSIATLS